MKNIYILSLVFGLFTIQMNAQAPRKVLVEEFTQASCAPCAASNPGFHKIIFNPSNDGKYTLLKYQTSWPGTDPMNQQNASEVQSRVNYYGVNSVPFGLADGGTTEGNLNIYKDHIANFTQKLLDARVQVTSPIELSVTHVIADALDSIEIQVQIKNVSAADIPDNYTLHVAIIEKTINFGTAPGTNGELEFFSVMRKMVPNAGGTKTGVLTAGGMNDYKFKVALPAYIYSFTNIGVVAFVQNTSLKEVMQSAESLPQPLPPNSKYLDLQAMSELRDYNGLCDKNISFAIEFKNQGTDSVNTISIDLMINNVRRTGQASLALNLAPGESGSYTFKNVNINEGRSNINYRINNINGSNKDIDKLNHTSPAVTVFNVKSAAFDTKLVQGFEVNATGVFPANSYGENYTSMRAFPASNAFFGVSQNIGGFAASPYSMFWDFYFGETNARAGIFFDKIDLSQSTKTQLAVSRAYAQLGAEQDAYLEIEASKDCGMSWTTVYRKEGSDLATVSPVPGTFFVPQGNQWIRDTVAMVEFDGEPEVIIRMNAYNPVSGSNLLFVDDLNIGNIVVGIQETGILSGLDLYPNPAHDQIQIDLKSEEAANAKVNLYSIQGTLVARLDSDWAIYSGINSRIFNLESINSGLYQLEISTEKGIRSQLISKQ